MNKNKYDPINRINNLSKIVKKLLYNTDASFSNVDISENLRVYGHTLLQDISCTNIDVIKDINCLKINNIYIKKLSNSNLLITDYNNNNNNITNNVGFGIDVFKHLENNISNKSNTAIGHASMKNVHNGSHNTAIGRLSLFCNNIDHYNNITNYPICNNNTCIGYNVFHDASDCINNIGIGNSCLHKTKNSNYVIKIGNEFDTCGNSTANQDISNCILIGHNIYKKTDISNNIIFKDNIIIGNYKQINGNNYNDNIIDISHNNIIIGNDISRNMLQDCSNTIHIGNTDTSWNFYVGDEYIFKDGYFHVKDKIRFDPSSNSTYIKNTAIGFESLNDSDRGKQNTTVGYRTLYKSVGGEQNTVMGSAALKNHSNSINNVAIGFHSMLHVHDGSGNIAIGGKSLGANDNLEGDLINSFNNISIGYNNLNLIRDGSNNISIGNNALIRHKKPNELIVIGHYDDSPHNMGINDSIYIGNNLYIDNSENKIAKKNIIIGKMKDFDISENYIYDLSDNNIFIGYDLCMNSFKDCSNTIQLGNPDISYNFNIGSDTFKSFIIDHPIKEKDKYLVHCCLEGPEAGVYYRGKGIIYNKEKYTTINLPNYFDKLIVKDSETINLTHIYDGKNLIYSATEIKNNLFRVYGKPGKFYWIVHAKRKNTEFEVEPNKIDVNVQGNGPYKYIN